LSSRLPKATIGDASLLEKQQVGSRQDSWNAICVGCGQPLAPEKWTCSSCQLEPEVMDGFVSFAPALRASDECYALEIIDELAILEAKNFWFRSRNRLIVWAIQQYFPKLKSFFEVGCGTGYVLTGIKERFPNIDLIGCDAMIQALGYARKRLPDAILYQMDACNMPFVDSFDVAGAFDVLEHIDDDEAVLSQMHKVLKPGGGLLITVPRFMVLWSKCDDFVKHVRRYEPGELEKKLGRAGFRVKRATSFVSMLLPILIASRVWQHLSPRPYNLVSELRVQGLVGKVLERVIDLERAIIDTGVNQPVGGSLLIVAEKI
jgi:SAM-dependent methyltransferase